MAGGISAGQGGKQTRVIVLGVGKVGKSVAEMLLAFGKGAYRVTLADHDEGNLTLARKNLDNLTRSVSWPVAYDAIKLDVRDPAQLRGALKGHDAVICMLPYQFVKLVAPAAVELGVHYFDVTEDVETTNAVRALATPNCPIALVPQCGLAPGYVAIAGNSLAQQFDQVSSLTLRVGALPQTPSNALKYNLTWSTDGVINEYCELCNVMLAGKQVQAPALEGLETFSLEGVEYEAFYTSGGVGTLIETLSEERRLTATADASYKTLRYPGHRDLMRFLLNDLGLHVEHTEPGKHGIAFDRQLLIKLFDACVPGTTQDVVVIFCSCAGTKDGRYLQHNFLRVVKAHTLFGRTWPAIESTTAAGVCAMVDLSRQGRLPRKTGFIRQEEVSLETFSETNFGLVYDDVAKVEAAVRGA